MINERFLKFLFSHVSALIPFFKLSDEELVLVNAIAGMLVDLTVCRLVLFVLLVLP